MKRERFTRPSLEFSAVVNGEPPRGFNSGVAGFNAHDSVNITGARELHFLHRLTERNAFRNEANFIRLAVLSRFGGDDLISYIEFCHIMPPHRRIRFFHLYGRNTALYLPN